MKAALLAGAALFAMLVALASHRAAPAAAAVVGRGSEAAFADGLLWREYIGRVASRWTTASARFRFRNLPDGPAVLRVAAHGHHAPVRVVVGGVVAGELAVGESAAGSALVVSGGQLDVTLLVEPFVARDGRRLGTLLDAVTLQPAPAGLVPPMGLTLAFVLPALAAAVAALAIGTGPPGSVAIACALSLAQALLLWPEGLLRSPYAATLSALLAGAAPLAFAGARLLVPDSARRPAAFAALVAAILVQGVVAIHPLMMGFDGVFHAHKLAEVARGELFPVSLTQHEPPFRFPYGVAFQALLAPGVWAGLDALELVRFGAAAAAVLACGALLFLLARRAPEDAALGTALLLTLPSTLSVFLAGNYSNVFAQAASIGFLAWWAGGAPGGAALGALLLAAGCLGHLSSAIVLFALAAALLAVDGRRLLRDRTRSLAVALGLGCAALYYLHFADLVLAQAQRLLEGVALGGGARHERAPLASALFAQARGAWQLWGWPAIVLALIGRPRAGGGALDRALVSFWLAGAALLLAAVVSPLEVRYLYALSPAIAIAGAAGFRTLSRRGALPRAAALGLVAAQAALAARELTRTLLTDWRV
jgi:hypothetical protein